MANAKKITANKQVSASFFAKKEAKKLLFAAGRGASLANAPN
jgi:hypothetical protein